MSNVGTQVQQLRAPSWLGNSAGGGVVAEVMLVLGAADGANYGLYQWDTVANTFTLVHSLPHGASDGCGHGFSGGEIIVCGGGYDAYYDGNAWAHTHVTAKVPSASHKVQGATYGAGPLWVFCGATWYRWNGTIWLSGAIPAACMSGSSGNGQSNGWGASASEAWVRCLGNTLYRTTNGGTSWNDYSAQVLADTGQSLLNVTNSEAIWGFGANEVYFGDSGRTRVIKWDGANFSTHMTDARLQYSINIWGIAPEQLLISGTGGSAEIYTFLNGVLKDTSGVLSYWKCRMYGTNDGLNIINLLGNGRARLSVDGGATWSAPPPSWPYGIGNVPDICAVGVP